jgi:HlyD family secretion protein
MKQLELPPISLNGAALPVGSPPRRRGASRKRWWLAALAAIALAVTSALVVLQLRAGARPTFATQPVARQTFVQTVTASGTVNPQDTIAVGSQVSGTISEIDVDYNSTVHAGQVLARLDPTPFRAALDQAQAALAQTQAQARAASASAVGSQASIVSAQATLAGQRDTTASNQAAIEAARANVTKSASALTFAQQTVARDKALLSQGYLAPSQADSDGSALAAAQAAYDGAQVALQQARAQASASASQTLASQAQVQQQDAQAQGAAATSDASVAAIGVQQAQVEQAQINLAHATIASPVDGTVIARGVSVGQTVAASFQTPTLFTIARDLKKMEVDLNVGEPDIGAVKAGDPVAFTVLAHPNDTFHGVVSQVRQNPTTIQNVVTYQTVVLVDNGDGRLRPGMTANATIDVSSLPNALVVPLQALSYTPPGGSVARRRSPSVTSSSAASSSAPSNSTSSNSALSAAASSPWGASLDANATLTPGGAARLFVERSGSLQPVPVRVDAIQGTSAAVTALRGTLNAGDAVVTGDSVQAGAHRSTQASSGVLNNASPNRRTLGGIR